MMYRIAVLFLVTLGSVRAATINAASLSRDDVNTAVQSAQAGDTVVLPAGPANWTNGIVWNAPANVTLKGAGTTATGGGDMTVIQDNYNSSSPLLQINASGPLRVTGITFQSGTASIVKENGTITIYGTSALRIDHCRFIASAAANVKMIQIGAGVFGVLDSCILDFTGTKAIYVYNGRDNGTGGGQGNYEWTLPTDFGASSYFFIEDNIINGYVDGVFYSSRVLDGWTAARAVVRFNTLYQCVVIDTHATGHAGDDRGWRSFEAYGNLVTTSSAALNNDPWGPNFCAVHISGGTALVWGNSWGNVYKNIYLLAVTRANNGTYTQYATPTGWGYAGTDFNGTGSNWDGGTYNGTDTVYGYPAIDQPGRGQGQLITGTFPSKINSVTNTIAWPNQALEPLYFWNNAGGIASGWGGSTVANTAGSRLQANRDYYLPASGVQTSKTSPFNGTSGVGWGTLEHRPDAPVTPGVGYFAIDQGDWNTSTSNPYGVQMNGADGILYIANSEGQWQQYYEPYEYPHPLRGESSAPTFRPGKSRLLRR